MLDQITPLIITYNEAPNIARTVGKLSWAKRIVVIDSGSTDETLDMLRSFPQVDVIEHPFSDFASQCNFGLGQVGTPWVLSLDADYELSDELVEELAGLRAPDDVAGYRARFVYRIHGRALRGTLYPPRAVLYRKDKAHYRNVGHGHRVAIDGEISRSPASSITTTASHWRAGSIRSNVMREPRPAISSKRRAQNSSAWAGFAAWVGLRQSPFCFTRCLSKVAFWMVGPAGITRCSGFAPKH